MSSKKRPYQKRERAEAEAETRRRITESTVALHGTLGPARTSVSAIARHAGVRRSTLYRHFPDERSLFVACTSHWMAGHPPPDADAWAVIVDPDERLRTALTSLYQYYEVTEQMLHNLIRDEDTVPLVRELFAAFRSYLASAQGVLLDGWNDDRATGPVRAAVGHAVSFSSWQSLVREQDLPTRDAVELMCALVHAAGEPPLSPAFVAPANP